MSEQRSSYSIFDHTADIGVEVTAPSLPVLYETAAFALFDIMAEPRETHPDSKGVSLEVSVTAADLEELLVRWLSELLYLYDTRGLLLYRFEVVEVSAGRLRARVEGERPDPLRHRVKTEIKAVTYHQVTVKRDGDSWRARVVFDV